MKTETTAMTELKDLELVQVAAGADKFASIDSSTQTSTQNTKRRPIRKTR